MAALVASMALAQQRTVIVTNPSSLARKSETIAIPWDSLRSLPGKDQVLAVRQEGAATDLLAQLFDENLDGIPDRFLFQSDFAPGESKTFVIRATRAQTGSSASLVDARYVEPREDLAWENDRIAFRMYGPALAAEVNNGIDVWVKRVRYLIVKKWYEGEEQTPKIVYHEDHGEGADFFDVGKSLGCGGSGLWYAHNLFQPGVFSSYKIIATGPIRACFELYYDKWNIAGKAFKEVVRITLDAGQNLNHVVVSFKGVDLDEPVVVACGLVKRPNAGIRSEGRYRWTSLWGPTNADTTNGYLGTGIVLEPSEKGFSSIAGDTQELVLDTLDASMKMSYYAGAGWTRSGDFRSADDWHSYLDRFARNLESPVKVSLVSKK